MMSKNVYMLPSGKASGYVINYMEESMEWQNIYITSDEDIKEGDYVYHSQMFNHIGFTGIGIVGKQRSNQEFEITSLDGQYTYYTSKDPKVILTTDQDLIFDGNVQGIDDEFLEWFAKNPACEYVEVKKELLGYRKSSDIFWYEIIIPKEEDKQETLEEAAGMLYPGVDRQVDRMLFINGAKWQAKRMYSEEDMVEFAKWSNRKEDKAKKDLLKIWIERFKKK